MCVYLGTAGQLHQNACTTAKWELRTWDYTWRKSRICRTATLSKKSKAVPWTLRKCASILGLRDNCNKMIVQLQSGNSTLEITLGESHEIAEQQHCQRKARLFLEPCENMRSIFGLRNNCIKMLVQLRSGNSTLEITLGESHEIPFEKMSPSSISDTNNVQQWLTSNPSPNKKNQKGKTAKR